MLGGSMHWTSCPRSSSIIRRSLVNLRFQLALAVWLTRASIWHESRNRQTFTVWWNT